MLAPKAERLSSPFGLFAHIPVKRELPALGAFFSVGKEFSKNRYWLGNTNIYEEAACQRGFLFMKSEEKNIDGLIRELRAELTGDGAVESIIECVYVAPEVILLELFMQPQHTPLVARLNRVVEPVLTRYRAQKYTLLCYGYDERSVS